jgi:hypothetical protein
MEVPPMPLYTDNIEQARAAYAKLEERVQSAEQRAERLQSVIEDLKKRIPLTVEEASSLRQVVLDREAQIIKLKDQLQATAEPSTGVLLDNFIAMLGLAAAIGEASMPDRAIASVAATLQAHIALQAGSVGLRFYQPASSTAVGLATTSFEINKVPPPAGVSAPRNLYMVLETKQKLYTDSFWTRFETAGQIIAEIAKVIADTGAWNFGFLVQSALRIADLERNLAGLIAGAAPLERVKAYSAAADGLRTMCQALAAKTNPVAGDLFLLTAAVDLTTTIGRSLLL